MLPGTPRDGHATRRRRPSRCARHRACDCRCRQPRDTADVPLSVLRIRGPKSTRRRENVTRRRPINRVAPLRLDRKTRQRALDLDELGLAAEFTTDRDVEQIAAAFGVRPRKTATDHWIVRLVMNGAGTVAQHDAPL